VSASLAYVAISDRGSYFMTAQGQVLTSFGYEERGRYAMIRGDTAGVLGLTEEGQLLVLGTREPPLVDVAAPVRSVAAGTAFHCAVDASGSVLCFDPAPSADSLFQRRPRPVEGFRDALEVQISRAIICALQRGGRLVCGPPATNVEWSSFSAQPPGGVGHSVPATRYPVEIVARGARGFAVTDTSICMLGEDGAVRCVPTASPQERDAPAARSGLVRVQRLEDVQQIVSGSFHHCARTTAGDVLCWGGNGWGQLGLGGGPTTTDAPRAVALASPAVRLFGYATSTCALLEDEQLSFERHQVEDGHRVVVDDGGAQRGQAPDEQSVLEAPGRGGAVDRAQAVHDPHLTQAPDDHEHAPEEEQDVE
jgi:hypothetical protein